ncbi:MAG: O-antigen ligase family protein [Candidatus Promineifilaceae bacterium]|nr:O-antigen ligase family protein [Candidatus Promineifilaceae bacterium]
MKSKPFFSITFFVLAGLALLAAGTLHLRSEFLTRGVPHGLPEPINYGGSQLAINVYLDQAGDAELDETLSQIKALGITTLKQPFYYSESFDWQATDRLVEAVTNHGLQLVPLLDGDPANQFAPPKDLQQYASWVGEFAQRYGDVLQAYIIWDEPNLSSHWGEQPVNANEYAALLTAASAAIRRADNNAVIVTAALAPTTETGPMNLADDLYLQELYEADAAHSFDVVSGKPYGFDAPPDERAVGREALNFSRIILLREVMERNGDSHKAVWAGNWGWNSLPDNWHGAPSIWGEVSEDEQAIWTIAALDRARKEWPWMGYMFLENWSPDGDPQSPRWGFSIAGRPVEKALQENVSGIDTSAAYPGFHLANPDDLAQHYEGGWRFSPEFGADISQPAAGAASDEITFDFWGTDVGLRVRRANFRARLYVTVDGQPANALPHDENGAALILTSPDSAEDYISIETVAQGLNPGPHTLHVVASRGWDQWAVNGFSVGYVPAGSQTSLWIVGLVALSILFLILAAAVGRGADWGSTGNGVRRIYDRLGERGQMIVTAAAAALVSLTGWLTWGEQVAGMYRRLGDGGQLALTAAAASVFYVTPVFFLYIAALITLFFLIMLRPAWGLALVALTIPFYVPQMAKPVHNYRFSPVEIFTLVTLAAFMLKSGLKAAIQKRDQTQKFVLRWPRLLAADYAVLLFTAVALLSLFFTARLDVATNELRTVILVPAMFYFALRAIRPGEKEMWLIFDAYILGGVIVAAIGLWQYASGQNLITAEGGLMRLRSIYGSPNNVALYFGRMIPFLFSMFLMGTAANRNRRWLWAGAIIPIGLAMLLTFSKGGLLLGLPAGLLVVLWIWQRRNHRSPWPWAIAFVILGVAALFLAQQLPLLSERLNLGGATGIFRVNLWRSSLAMIREHPLFGVGLDNFLYAYRGRYIMDAAWQEPNLSHPHNIILDFATRLGLLGLIAGGWMIVVLVRVLRDVLGKVPNLWLPVAAGISGALGAMLIHGLVDHSFFLVDLAFVFYLMLGTAVWLDNLPLGPKITGQS